ncbi:uncharacterized protein LOC105383450 isoform X2 [Plutella xylostella]|uniref:uncharacterized protein LOC105383450 isoform X1 n=1 Tax=Plutella xylostella TaxID=51655 RepID=UPI0020326C45|nr:uncharacterized protein LOC105383450 isoform X1 [Plutella xylostella]XP_048478667.1 uncharacterized protein LOC105383450 isoform X2 [Plutella xylostella]
MAEPRGNHLDIDGGQVKEDEHISSYKPLPDTDSAPRAPKLTKSQEKLSSDGADEKLLKKEEEARIVTRVDMADAKYVVGDHRNGDAKIELDANKRQFSGLTKEELMKYAADPFWVRLRWFMFVLFWLLWLAMLAGAIAIIVQAPKCAAPVEKTWYEKGPLVDASSADAAALVSNNDILTNLQTLKVPGIIVTQQDVYKVLEDESALDTLKSLLNKAKEFGVKVIVHLAPASVASSHRWFQQSLNRSAEYAGYFIWANGTDFDEATGKPKPPNNWISKSNIPAWTWSEERKEFYYHQAGPEEPQLNFTNPDVVKQFDTVLKKLVDMGVGGVRLDVRDLLVDPALPDELMSASSNSRSFDHTQYLFWRHQHTSDQPALPELLAHWGSLLNADSGETVLTVYEDGTRAALHLLRPALQLRPAAAAPVEMDAPRAASRLTSDQWVAIPVLPAEGNVGIEVAAFSILLPASPVLNIALFDKQDNVTTAALSHLSRLVSLREDASIAHGNKSILAVPAVNGTDELLVCARWKPGHTGYAAVFNPSEEEQQADLSSVYSVPTGVTLHYASLHVKEATNYTIGQALDSSALLVPGKSTVVISYVPKTTVEK